MLYLLVILVLHLLIILQNFGFGTLVPLLEFLVKARNVIQVSNLECLNFLMKTIYCFGFVRNIVFRFCYRNFCVCRFPLFFCKLLFLFILESFLLIMRLIQTIKFKFARLQRLRAFCKFLSALFKLAFVRNHNRLQSFALFGVFNF